MQGLIDIGRIQRGQTLLLNGAGGGVGTIALQIAKTYDLEITVVDKSGKLEMLREMGADHLIDYQKEDFTRTGKTYDLILDTKTNRSPFAYLRALKMNGTYVTVGGSIARLLQVFAGSRLISRLYNKHVRMVGLKPNKDLAYMNELFQSGKLIPVIDRTFDLVAVPEAMQLFGTGHHKGKNHHYYGLNIQRVEY